MSRIAMISPSCFILTVAALCATGAGANPHKPRPAAELMGHVQFMRDSRCVIHVDAFTPDDVATTVWQSGTAGNSNKIRAAFGRFDYGFVKLGTDGYRIAYARRIVREGGVRLILLFRNSFDSYGLETPKTFVWPPLAAIDVWLPEHGDGQAKIATTVELRFESPDDVQITNWGPTQYVVTDLTPDW